MDDMKVKNTYKLAVMILDILQLSNLISSEEYMLALSKIQNKNSVVNNDSA